MTDNPPISVNQLDEEEDEADFTFDDLLANYPGGKRFTEVPHIDEKIMKKGQENVIYREEEYIKPEDLSAEEHMESLFTSPPVMSKRISTHNKLKDIAENPQRLKNIVEGSPERRMSKLNEEVKKELEKFQ